LQRGSLRLPVELGLVHHVTLGFAKSGDNRVGERVSWAFRRG
jgi:hypothetical protein